MIIRLIALDLDGTLLDDGKRLPDRNQNALLKCAGAGIHIVPCTGRLSGGIPREVLDLGVRYAITVNGGAIEDLREGKFLDRQFMDKETALSIMKMAEACPGVMYDTFVDNTGISQDNFYGHLDRYGISPGIQELIRNTRRPVPNIIEYVRQPGRMVNKVNLFFADLEERSAFREKLNTFPGILVTSAISNNLEINGAEASKGIALCKLAKHLSIPIEETMAFGDGENDLSMIRTAGVGIAMKNGEESLCACADYVTESNNDAGVARAIEHLIFSQKE